MDDKNPAELREHYELLGLSPGAPVKEIKRSARKLFLKYHPDLNPRNELFCEEKTKRIVEAYRNVLKARERESADSVAAAGDSGDENDRPDAIEVLIFAISHRSIAVPARHLREVLRVKDVRIEEMNMVTDEFPFVSGVFYRGGELVMLWDLHKQFRLRGNPIGSDFGKTKIITVEIGGSVIGFLVDEIKGIATIDRVAIRDNVSGFDIEDVWFDGEFETGEGPVLRTGLLNMEKIIYNWSDSKQVRRDSDEMNARGKP
jgi:chemotaxis signal transduction protein